MRSWLKNTENAESIVTIYDDDVASVTTHWRIHSLLERTFDSHCLLNVRIIDGSEGAYGSVIVQIGTNRNCLILDGLTPGDGNARLARGRAITVSTLLNNLQLTFTSTVLEIAETNPTRIRIVFPELVYYAQHRREHRVPLPMNWPATVSIRLNKANRFGGVVRDLSSGGFCVQLEAPLPLPVEQLPFPLPFSLALAVDRIIQGEMEICYVYRSEFGKLPRIGTRILMIPPHHQHVLDQCIAEIDRQQSRLR
jgi:c-di-GMP-binding flagellar brake protein YcgR